MRAIVSASFRAGSFQRADRASPATCVDAIPQVLTVAVSAADRVQVRVTQQQLQEKPCVLERDVGVEQQLTMRLVRVAEQATEFDGAGLRARLRAPQAEGREHAREHRRFELRTRVAYEEPDLSR